jgi:DNA-binding NarL/FixJ family response regulator
VIRVVVVDDHAVVRAGLASLLASAGDIACVGEAADGTTALEVVQQLDPDVVLLDLSMPGKDGVATIQDMRARNLRARVLVLTSFAHTDLVLDAVRAGADGYLLKESEAESILQGIRTVAAGHAPVDPAVAGSLLHTVRDQASASTIRTEREREVLDLVRQGLPNKSIARQLSISEHTVKAHLTRILQRVGATDRIQAALWAERHLPRRRPPEEER